MQISQTKLSAFPTFLRFNDVSLSYMTETTPIELLCAQFVGHLKPIKSALKHSNLVTFSGDINEYYDCRFRSHLQLIDHLRYELLPICNSSRAFKFNISADEKDANVGTNVIASLLQFPQISRCPEVVITFEAFVPVQLPIESIALWLSQKSDENKGQCLTKCLIIRMISVANALELCDRFAEISFNFSCTFYLHEPVSSAIKRTKSSEHKMRL